MKLNRIILPVLACTLMLGSCEDNKMEWATPDGHGKVSISDMPLELKEKLANYDYIKAYAAQYTPNLIVGLGLGADEYIGKADYKAVADANFQMFTTGNAMKHQSVVQSDGTLKFTTIDAFLEAVPADIKVYGHNFIWHTQQNQTYLKNLIAPEVVIPTSDPTEKIENVITNSDFEENNTTGWIFNGSGYSATVVEGGYNNSSYALKCQMNDATSQNYDSQLFQNLPQSLEKGETYILSFAARSPESINVQIVGQNQSDHNIAIYEKTYTMTDSWIPYEYEFAFNEDKDINKIGLQFGGTKNSTLFIDDFKFGKKKDDPDAGRTNLLANGDFAENITSWARYNGTEGCNTWNSTEGYKKAGCIQIVNGETNEQGNIWKTQIHANLTTNIPAESNVCITYYAKTSSGTGNIRISTTGDTHYQTVQPVTTEWQRIVWDITTSAEITGINIEAGMTPGTYLVDDIIVSYEPQAMSSGVKALRAGSITYIPKTAEEKKTALLGAMESWIKGMAEHVGDRVKDWDVINEPITDNCQWRGIDGAFGGMDSENKPDTAPTEDENNGLNLNWSNDAGNGHFYWGYYLGKEYATKAFEYARQYCAQGSRLYVNEYNLETNPNKLAALVEFVKYIDQNNTTGAAIVDGIGTQMHITASSIQKKQIDDMFKSLAATGKLIRVTELDVALGTATPSADQLATQAEIYQMIFESYKENIPESQQSGITIWTLSDHADEHKYWLKDQSPNLFDANYARKHAYKGVCDGIAGKDISADFTGEDWKKFYE